MKLKINKQQGRWGVVTPMGRMPCGSFEHACHNAYWLHYSAMQSNYKEAHCGH